MKSFVIRVMETRVGLFMGIAEAGRLGEQIVVWDEGREEFLAVVEKGMRFMKRSRRGERGEGRKGRGVSLEDKGGGTEEDVGDGGRGGPGAGGDAEVDAISE